MESRKETRTVVSKVWGFEIWVVNRVEYCGKLLLLNKNATSSYHCHRLKTETFYCLEGQALLTIEGTEYDLNPVARAKTITPGEFHSFKGLAKTVLLEVSTHHDDTDVERKTESKPGQRSWKRESIPC